MSGNSGWIKIHRSIMEHWVWEDPLLLKIWLDILMTANHESRKVTINKNVVLIERGQFFTSISKLAKQWKIDRKTATKYLNLFQEDGMIYSYAQQGIGTLITVRNYDKFQGFQENDSTDLSTKDSAKDSTKDSANQSQSLPHKQELNNDLRIQEEERERPTVNPWGVPYE